MAVDGLKRVIFQKNMCTSSVSEEVIGPTVRRPTLLALITLLCIWSAAVFFQSAHAQATAEDTSTINLKNVDIHSLIETVSKRSGKNFIVDPRVRATVTVISSEPVDGDQLYELFLSVLDVHGFAAVPAGSFTKIVPAINGVQSAVPVLKEPAQAGDELVTEVIHVRHVPVQQMVESLRPLLPASASLSAEANSNTLIITDRASNIARLVQIIQLLDSSG